MSKIKQLMEERVEKMEVLTEYDWYEMMDRTYVLMDSFGTYVGEHKVCAVDKEAEEMADRVMTVLHDAYQYFGRKCFEERKK